VLLLHSDGARGEFGRTDRRRVADRAAEDGNVAFDRRAALRHALAELAYVLDRAAVCRERDGQCYGASRWSTAHQVTGSDHLDGLVPVADRGSVTGSARRRPGVVAPSVGSNMTCASIATSPTSRLRRRDTAPSEFSKHAA
jgi:hypothetical protein